MPPFLKQSAKPEPGMPKPPLAPSVLLVGCGKMGGALLQSWQEKNICSRIDVVDPHCISSLAVASRADSIRDLPGNACHDVIVFAVKPQVLPDTVGEYRECAERGALILSIAAGKPIGFFEKHLGKTAKIVRAMPNTPAAIGKGITVACANRNVAPAERGKAETLLGAVGEVLWVNDESVLDPVTALSGSGPAYVFLLIETLTKSGIHIGLPADMAERLARQTVIGSAALAAYDNAVPAAQLRENVTSPGGTTAAALEILMKEPALQDLFDRALDAANRRAKELSRG